jgi:hypothetical protein
MRGGFLVLLWLALFAAASTFLCRLWNIQSALMRTIFVWSFLMLFVALFEGLLLFYHDYVAEQGTYYYNENKCYWTEEVSWTDMFSHKMYMDLYADYSYCDKRYSNVLKDCQGCRTVMTGEIIHGVFSLVLASWIVYLFSVGAHELHVILTSLVFSGAQLGIIVWYLSTIAIETQFVRNDKVWWPPCLWNVPWVVVPTSIVWQTSQHLLRVYGTSGGPVEGGVVEALTMSVSEMQPTKE